MFLFLGRQTPPPTVKKSQITRQPLCRSVGSGFCLPIVPASGPALSLVPSDQSEPLVPASSPSLPLMSSRSDSLKKLLLTFNGGTFYILSDLIAHICDYPKEEKRVALYVNVVKQASKFFDLGSAFAEGLIKAIQERQELGLCGVVNERGRTAIGSP